MIRNKITDLDIKNVYLNSNIDWEKFKDKTFFITGGTGVIGSFIIRCLRHANKYSQLNIKIIVATRNIENAQKFFGRKSKENFKFYKNDVIDEIKYNGHIDYIIHCANNTSSASFVENPVETFNVAVKGTENILNFARKNYIESMVYLSSMEVYGKINEPKLLKETDLGDLDITEVRSSYPMGKRAAENLCYSYAKEYNVPVKVVRLAQVIGANVDYDDTRVYAQFARSIIEKRDIVLKTKANTKRSFLYITDAVTGILTILTNGKNGECYNNNNNNFPTISEIARDLSLKYPSTKIIYDIDEKTPYAPETHWILDNSKLQSLGWEAKVSLDEAYNKLISSFYYQKFQSDNLNKQNMLSSQKKHRNYNIDTFAEKVFSIKNKGKYKVVKIAGLRIAKIRLAKKDIQNFYNLPIEENKIVFSNFKGSGYGCNPKYITEEILKRGLHYKLVWLIKNDTTLIDIPENIEIVDFNSLEALKELITAKVWIDNQRKLKHIQNGLIKRIGQIYIQTWHGSLGIKKIGEESPLSSIQNNWILNGKEDALMTDFLISNSTFEKKVFINNFWDNGEIKMFGHPRNDIFFKSQQELCDIKYKVYNNLGINITNKTFIYMPSFRDDMRLDCYMLDVQLLKSVLEHKFGGIWTVIIRLHPRIQQFSKLLFEYDKNIVDASNYPDIQELLVASDVAMTDYSSCIFDFMLSKKPAFIFATDIEKYNTERGFYYPLESTPFLVSTDNIELMENIRNFDYEKYKQEVEIFLKEKGCMEDGKASKRVVDLIEEILKNNKQT